MNKQNGFTMVELIVIISIIAIASALAFPSIKASFPRIDLNSQVSMLQNDFQMTRFKAINKNCPYKIVFTLSTTTQDRYSVEYLDDGGGWEADSDISNRTINKNVDIAYIDSSGNTSGNFEKIFYPDGSYGDGATTNDGALFLKFPDQVVNNLGYDVKKKISIAQTTGFIQVKEGW